MWPRSDPEKREAMPKPAVHLRVPLPAKQGCRLMLCEKGAAT